MNTEPSKPAAMNGARPKVDDAKRREIEAALREHLQSDILAPGVEFESDTPFEMLGIDSMSLVQLLLRLETEFGVEIPDSELTRANTENLAAMATCAARYC